MQEFLYSLKCQPGKDKKEEEYYFSIYYSLRTLRENLSVEFVLNKTLIHNPGKVFNYNDGCPQLISAMIAKETGLSMRDFADKYLFKPLGVTNYRWDNHHDGITFLSVESTEPCVYLDIRSTVGIDIGEYPDSGKIKVTQINEVFEKQSHVDYNKGEENVQMIWDMLKND